RRKGGGMTTATSVRDQRTSAEGPLRDTSYSPFGGTGQSVAAELANEAASVGEQRRLAIAHTEASNGWGGQEIRILTEAAGFIARGHRAIVLAADGARILHEAPRYGVPAKALPIARKTLRGVKALAQSLSRERVDIVNT